MHSNSNIGFDAVAHMIEEIPNPTVEGPKIMIACVGIGVFTGFVFLTVLLLVAGDVDNVIESAAGPLLAIFYNATSSKAGSICLLMYATCPEVLSGNNQCLRL